jgi:DNA polymerase-3 subunit delta'
MEDLLLDPQTLAHLKSLQADPPHGVLLTGPTGVGKLTVALAWARGLTTPSNISQILPDEKGTISIDTARGLYQLTRSRHSERQVVIIDNAQAMGAEAQNALLKLLEEPNASVIFMLTAPTPEVLLPTIASRVQRVDLPRLPKERLQTFLAAQAPKFSPQQTAQALFIADGRPGTLNNLLKDPAMFEHYRQIMQTAKQLLAASDYERLASVSTLAKDRAQTTEVLEAMSHMLYSQILHDPQPKLVSLANRLETCLVRLAQNGNPRAQLTALFVAQ